jgi:hypothetical protein
MRNFRWILVCCVLLAGSRAFALEFFGDFLYWQATEPVDWTLKTNDSTTDQYVQFRNVEFDFAPGFRVGLGSSDECQWGAKLYYTRFCTQAEDAASGYVTPVFLPSKMALPRHQSPFFHTGNIQAKIDYNVIDLDFGKSFSTTESFRFRPVLGLRGAWINQAFGSEFQGSWPSTSTVTWETVDERIENDFWGIGPKLGIENSLNLWRGERSEINFTLNFYTAYLLGFWTIKDAAVTTNNNGASDFNIPIDNRDFGALTFQAMVGMNFKCGNWSAEAGYEINDWLNQCQIFDDATGPHNNDLVLQGLSARVGYRF